MPSPQTAPAHNTPLCPSVTKAAFVSFAPPRETCASEPGYPRYPCFAPQREMYVLHREFGRIVEISMGGVRFTYFDRDFFPAEPPAQGLLFTNTDDFLDEIPFLVVSDKAVSHLFASKYLLKERRVRFGELTDNQVRKLERFILKNAHIPQLSHDSRYADYKSLHATER